MTVYDWWVLGCIWALTMGVFVYAYLVGFWR